MTFFPSLHVANTINIKDFEMRRLSWIICVGPISSHESLKERPFPNFSKKENRANGSVRRTQPIIFGFEEGRKRP